MKLLISLPLTGILLLLSGCGGLTTDPLVSKTIRGNAMIASAVNPCVGIFTETDGAYLTVCSVMVLKPAVADPIAVPFELPCPTGQNGVVYHLMSYNDKNANEVMDYPAEYLGECEYRLVYSTATKLWSYQDVFGDTPEWGADATECDGSDVIIPAEYLE